MSKTPNSVPALRPALAEQDWDFSAVPIDELVPCLLWEYLRESHTAQQLFLEAKRLDNMSKLRPITEGIKINDPLELSGFVDAWFFASLYPNALNTPWQLLIPRAKRLMTTPCALVDPAVYLSKGDLHIDQLQVAIRKAMKDAHEERPQGSVYVSVSDLHSSQRSRAEVTSNKEDCDPVMASYIWKMVGRDPARPLALEAV